MIENYANHFSRRKKYHPTGHRQSAGGSEVSKAVVSVSEVYDVTVCDNDVTWRH